MCGSTLRLGTMTDSRRSTTALMRGLMGSGTVRLAGAGNRAGAKLLLLLLLGLACDDGLWLWFRLWLTGLLLLCGT